MKVYLAYRYWSQAGADLLAIFTEEELAKEFLVKFAGTHDSTYVVEMTAYSSLLPETHIKQKKESVDG